jgi:hypothetical protein
LHPIRLAGYAKLTLADKSTDNDQALAVTNTDTGVSPAGEKEKGRPIVDPKGLDGSGSISVSPSNAMTAGPQPVPIPTGPVHDDVEEKARTLNPMSNNLKAPVHSHGPGSPGWSGKEFLINKIREITDAGRNIPDEHAKAPEKRKNQTPPGPHPIGSSSRLAYRSVPDARSESERIMVLYKIAKAWDVFETKIRVFRSVAGAKNFSAIEKVIFRARPNLEEMDYGAWSISAELLQWLHPYLAELDGIFARSQPWAMKCVQDARESLLQGLIFDAVPCDTALEERCTDPDVEVLLAREVNVWALSVLWELKGHNFGRKEEVSSTEYPSVLYHSVIRPALAQLQSLDNKLYDVEVLQCGWQEKFLLDVFLGHHTAQDPQIVYFLRDGIFRIMDILDAPMATDRLIRFDSGSSRVSWREKYVDEIKDLIPFGYCNLQRNVPVLTQGNTAVTATDESTLAVSNNVKQRLQQPVGEQLVIQQVKKTVVEQPVAVRQQHIPEPKADRTKEIAIGKPKIRDVPTSGQTDNESQIPFKTTTEDNFKDLAVNTCPTSALLANTESEPRETHSEQLAEIEETVQKQTPSQALVQETRPKDIFLVEEPPCKRTVILNGFGAIRHDVTKFPDEEQHSGSKTGPVPFTDHTDVDKFVAAQSFVQDESGRKLFCKDKPCERCGNCLECQYKMYGPCTERVCNDCFCHRKSTSHGNDMCNCKAPWPAAITNGHIVSKSAINGEDDDVHINLGPPKVPEPVFGGRSLPLDFPRSAFSGSEKLVSSKLSKTGNSVLLIEEYLAQDPERNILNRIKSLDTKEHQIVLRNYHLKICGRIWNCLTRRRDAILAMPYPVPNPDLPEDHLELFIDHKHRAQLDDELSTQMRKVHQLQGLLMTIHPDVKRRDWEALQKAFTQNRICAYINKLGGCKNGPHCDYSHVLEGEPCPLEQGHHKCPQPDRCVYKHKKSGKKPCRYGKGCYRYGCIFEHPDGHVAYQITTPQAQGVYVDTRSTKAAPSNPPSGLSRKRSRDTSEESTKTEVDSISSSKRIRSSLPNLFPQSPSQPASKKLVCSEIEQAETVAPLEDAEQKFQKLLRSSISRNRTSIIDKLIDLNNPEMDVNIQTDPNEKFDFDIDVGPLSDSEESEPNNAVTISSLEGDSQACLAPVARFEATSTLGDSGFSQARLTHVEQLEANPPTSTPEETMSVKSRREFTPGRTDCTDLTELTHMEPKRPARAPDFRKEAPSDNDLGLKIRGGAEPHQKSVSPPRDRSRGDFHKDSPDTRKQRNSDNSDHHPQSGNRAQKKKKKKKNNRRHH